MVGLYINIIIKAIENIFCNYILFHNTCNMCNFVFLTLVQFFIITFIIEI